MIHVNFKAKVQRLIDLPSEDMRNLFSWPTLSTLQTENPNLLIAKAVDSRNDVFAYVTAEPVLLVDSYVLNPKSKPEDDQSAGDSIDKALAQQAGANRLWVVIPSGAPPMEGEKLIRVLERKITQPVTTLPKAAHCKAKFNKEISN